MRTIHCPLCDRVLMETDMGPAGWAATKREGRQTPRCRDCDVAVGLTIDHAGEPAIVAGAAGEPSAKVAKRAKKLRDENLRRPGNRKLRDQIKAIGRAGRRGVFKQAAKVARKHGL